MDGPTFRSALVVGTGVPLLFFDVPALVPSRGFAHVGTVVVAPAPGTADFDEATLFELRAECRWQGADGETSLRLATLFCPVGESP